MSICNICPRNCNIDRSISKGYCSSSANISLARASLHMWEEPCISGSRGSGTIFFSGCNLRCVYCQNYNIANSSIGMEVTNEHLADIMLDLQDKSAHNINLVTPSHYVPNIIEAIDIAKRNGLSIPIVYNTSSYESADTLRSLDGLIDIYLPDFKYFDNDLAIRFSHAPDYCLIATSAIDEMTRQQPECVFSDDGMMKKGVIIRHMILPGHTNDSKQVINHVYNRYEDNVYISIMNQYTPLKNVSSFPEINRKVTKREYEKVLDYAINLGINNAFFQDGKTQDESFIPEFDFRGI